MTKSEIKSAIDAAGGVKEHRSPTWDEAFKLFNSDNKNSPLKRGSCGSCYRKVYEWLSR